MSRYALVIAGCLSGERGDAGVAALVDELAAAAGADVVLRARTGGRPVGASLPEVLVDLRERGVRRALVAVTHVADGRLQREAAGAARAAAPGFDELRLASPLLASGEDLAAVARALDEALPAEPGRVVALAGHRGAECEVALARLEAALRARGRGDVLVDAPDRLAARLRERSGRRVLLAPLLMALGHHARHDVLVDLRARLEGAGLDVAIWPHSLAELPAVRGLAIAHALAAERIMVG
ncbi:sirohydrochlorin cobaltochelatase [Thermophilibacter sp. ET337]|uniref:sirohydrochlorin cobaltochelatase n=1 Tax=Thermophilibacter sp. ET337 TaxID=2973084 RepID=UPI0021ABEE24|nr:sirohydrochlorin cobaltochelatase [Thermophilibacter sp. ET337]MCR8908200.1 sirohydrochlorin cobaltochelatase [Thermophilibacter sp. ET337]